MVTETVIWWDVCVVSPLDAVIGEVETARGVLDYCKALSEVRAW